MKVCFMGLGYIGLPTAIVAADNGIEVTKFRTMKLEKPYVEVSYGIENLFKVVRIQAFHRLSYLDKGPDGKTVYPFAVKASFIFRL